jgi:hypothetical protein
VALTPCGDEPVWVTRGSGEFLAGLRAAEGKILAGVAGSRQGDTREAKQADALAEARRRLRSQIAAYSEPLSRHLGARFAKYVPDEPEKSLQMFLDVAESLKDLPAEDLEPADTWHCPVTAEVFARVQITERQLHNVYMERAQEIATERKDELFMDKTDQMLEELHDALIGWGARSAGADMAD